jgi:long-chain acyl-CoA synthetase
MQQSFGVLDAVHNALPDVLDGHSRSYANKTAIACDGARLSWAQFGSRLNTFANLLTGWGIGRGDRVVILGSNSIDALVAIFGVMKAGACAVPLSTMLSSEQLAVMISDTGARAVCVSHECAPLVEPVRESITGIPRSGWLALDFVGDSWQSYPSLVSGVRDDHIERRYDALDPCMIIYSSGTTGSPKGIVHSHYSRYELAQLCALEMRFNYQSRVLPRHRYIRWALS